MKNTSSTLANKTDFEFGWFVGLYEGEGTFFMEKGKYPKLVLKIDMTDRDTVERCSRFLGVKVQTLKLYGNQKKEVYRVKKQGGLTSQLADLIMKMKPHLCARRQSQIDHALGTLSKVKTGS